MRGKKREVALGAIRTGCGASDEVPTLQAAWELRCCSQISPEPPHRARYSLPPQRVFRETNKDHRLVPLDLRGACG